MTGLCECGCGERPNLSPVNDRARGRRKGQPYRFILGHAGRKPGWQERLNRPPVESPAMKDARAIAFYTGAADARNGRPRRVDRADTSMIGDEYTRGYASVVERAAGTPPLNGDWTPFPAGGSSAGCGVGGPLDTRPEQT